MRHKGIDVIVQKHLDDDLKHIAQADCLSDFDKDDANFCLSEIADSGYILNADGKNHNSAFTNFYGAINITVDNPIDYGVSKIKKLYKQ